MDLCIMAACAPALRSLYLAVAERIGLWRIAYSRSSRGHRDQDDKISSAKVRSYNIKLGRTRQYHIKTLAFSDLELGSTVNFGRDQMTTYPSEMTRATETVVSAVREA